MKRTVSWLVVICCLCAYLIPVTSAFADQICASEYFDSCFTTASSSITRKLNVEYCISPTGPMSQAGVQEIRVYTSGGTLVQTIIGTTANGLLKTNTRGTVSGAYTVSNLTSGQSYYAEVDLYAADANGSDMLTATTNTVKVH